MQNHYHAVVWIDHRQARAFDFNTSESEKVVMRPDNPARHLHRKTNSIGAATRPKIGTSQQVAKPVGDAAPFSSLDRPARTMNWSNTSSVLPR
jgi:hypothetical protein